jgi:DNA invertase Pin-like site-specific DNA recombinase
MLIGDALVSAQDQNFELQREALTKAGCEKVFEDKVSGTLADRPGLSKARKCCAQATPWWSGSGIVWA